jgi:hypothetical protein
MIGGVFRTPYAFYIGLPISAGLMYWGLRIHVIFVFILGLGIGLALVLWPRARKRPIDVAPDSETPTLGRLEPGGAADRPIVVESSSQIDVHASRAPCLACEGSVRVRDHRADTVDGQRLRIVGVACVRCGAERVFYFRIGTIKN